MSLSSEMAMQNMIGASQEELTFVEAIRGPYSVASLTAMPDPVATKIVQLVLRGLEYLPKEVLGGRGQTGAHELPHYGRVFVKRYAHGGLLRSITRGRFLCVGPIRSRAEFEMLERVRALGVNAPKPYVYVTCGSFVYSTWLIMEEIPNTKSLVELSAQDSDGLQDAMRKLSVQLLTLIKNNILHVDLHPGNVLVNEAGAVFIIDFDKARVFSGTQHQLRDLYLTRWRRAVIKHGLSPLLTELMSLTLRSYDD